MGQSGTDSPASLLVTRAPAMISRKTQHARKTAKRWWARLYGVARPFRNVLLDSSTRMKSCPSRFLHLRGRRNADATYILNKKGTVGGVRPFVSCYCLNVWSTVLLSFAATVTF